MSADFLEAMVIQFCCRGAADKVTLKFLEQLSPSDKFRNSVVMRIVPTPFFTWQMPGFIKQEVNSTIDHCHLKQLCTETEKVDRKKVLLPPSASFLHGKEKKRNFAKKRGI